MGGSGGTPARPVAGEPRTVRDSETRPPSDGSPSEGDHELPSKSAPSEERIARPSRYDGKGSDPRPKGGQSQSDVGESTPGSTCKKPSGSDAGGDRDPVED